MYAFIFISALFGEHNKWKLYGRAVAMQKIVEHDIRVAFTYYAKSMDTKCDRRRQNKFDKLGYAIHVLFNE